MTQGRGGMGEVWTMASGAFQMIDECGYHDDGANEMVILETGLADGYESLSLSHTHTGNKDSGTSTLKTTLYLLQT